MVFNKRKIKVIVIDNGRKIPIPSISISLAIKILKVSGKISKRHVKKEHSKYIDIVKQIDNKDIKVLIDSLPKESFDLVDIKSEDGSVVYIRII